MARKQLKLIITYPRKDRYQISLKTTRLTHVEIIGLLETVKNNVMRAADKGMSESKPEEQPESNPDHKPKEKPEEEYSDFDPDGLVEFLTAIFDGIEGEEK